MNTQDKPLLLIGDAFRRSHAFPFGIRQHDRLLHLYMIGQTGTGKSTLLGNMIWQDIEAEQGVCIVDPHGDLAESLEPLTGDDGIYWNVSDRQSPYGYNPLTKTSDALRPLVASGLIDALKKQWADAWGVRMEHLLRYAVLALLEQSRADLRDIMRLFIDRPFRRNVIARVSDPQVREFWTSEFPAMNYKTAIDGVAPIANKLGAFLSHPVIRRAVCEPEQPLRFRRMMDHGQTLIVNLAKGRIGADMANVVGGLLTASIMNAALSRHDIPESIRRPYMLYVDEFHAFTTLSFASLLSEVRKYGLGVTLAHQYIEQADPAVSEAVFGNVGSMITFRVGALDAPLIERQLGSFSVTDLIALPNYRAHARIMVDGEPTRAFSVRTWPANWQRRPVS
ncbi:MAG: type IV secretion system DNA-binding domain-containing protein [Hyphomicrobiales bacterium]|nr:type IV secretion system DNA-binding domain-containing protein [Hyphomicrobiales bacterium]